MYRIKRAGNIDHNIISVYTDSRSSVNSLLKIGGWDQVAIKDGAKLEMFRTNNNGNWMLGVESYQFNKMDLVDSTQTRYVFLEPQLPFIYIPDSDFKTFRTVMKNSYPNIECDTSKNYCRFLEKCEDVRTADQDFDLVIKDVTGKTVNYQINEQDMLIPGSTLKESDNTCYIAIFNSAVKNSDNSLYLGDIFFNKFYVVFDMTPYDERNEKYIQIGLAEKNPINNIGRQQYDEDYEYYWPEK
mmetsp:Transcript_8602/g.14529  ORF Transcript_8602/g.14529 Transcript_8602/m.14529 type:complete len:242 (+) Transcript_8602:551-1276(+)